MNIKSYLKELSPNLKYLNHIENDKEIIINVESKIKKLSCPMCGYESDSVNTKYLKKIEDLPINNKIVNIKIMNRVMECKNPNCSQKTFSEQYDFMEINDTKTTRLLEKIREVASKYTLRKAAEVLKSEGIKVGKSTLGNIKKTVILNIKKVD